MEPVPGEYEIRLLRPISAGEWTVLGYRGAMDNDEAEEPLSRIAAHGPRNTRRTGGVYGR